MNDDKILTRDGANSHRQSSSFLISSSFLLVSGFFADVYGSYKGIHSLDFTWPFGRGQSFERQSGTIGAAKAAVMHEHPGKWWLNVPPSCERAAPHTRTHTHTFLCICVKAVKAFHVYIVIFLNVERREMERAYIA